MTSKPWLRHYDPDVPPTLAPYPPRTLIDVLRDAAGERPNHPALIFNGSQLSYEALERLSSARMWLCPVCDAGSITAARRGPGQGRCRDRRRRATSSW
jgi:hypothetical protein